MKIAEVDVDELADPLLSTGIASTIKEVKDLIKVVDKDDSGEIGFEEFLKVMQPKGNGKRGMGHGLGDSNPIAQLQKIQNENGNIDMKVVVAMQRRKFLMNAVVGEMKRRENALRKISDLEAEAKQLKGKGKYRLLHDIKTRTNSIQKSFIQKQNFVSAMQGMINKAKQAEMNALEQFKDEMKNDTGRTLTLTEAIDEFGMDFELKKLKVRANERAERLLEGLKESVEEEKPLRGIASRGLEERNLVEVAAAAGASVEEKEDVWYKISKLKVTQQEEERGHGKMSKRANSIKKMQVKKEKKSRAKRGLLLA